LYDDSHDKKKDERSTIWDNGRIMDEGKRSEMQIKRKVYQNQLINSGE
jgi:hypothetical protein